MIVSIIECISDVRANLYSALDLPDHNVRLPFQIFDQALILKVRTWVKSIEIILEKSVDLVSLKK